jgi:hypothetical protein
MSANQKEKKKKKKKKKRVLKNTLGGIKIGIFLWLRKCIAAGVDNLHSANRLA